MHTWPTMAHLTHHCWEWSPLFWLKSKSQIVQKSAWSNTVPHLSETEQSAVELQRFKYWKFGSSTILYLAAGSGFLQYWALRSITQQRTKCHKNPIVRGWVIDHWTNCPRLLYWRQVGGWTCLCRTFYASTSYLQVYFTCLMYCFNLTLGGLKGQISQFLTPAVKIREGWAKYMNELFVRHLGANTGRWWSVSGRW